MKSDMRPISYTPKWRDDKRNLTVYLAATLLDIARDPQFTHDNGGTGSTVCQVWFGVTDSGTVVTGDAWDIMHRDICLASDATGDREMLLVGVASHIGDVSTWEIILQGFTCRRPQILVDRLSTWHAFIAGSVVKVKTGICSALE